MGTGDIPACSYCGGVTVPQNRIVVSFPPVGDGVVPMRCFDSQSCVLLFFARSLRVGLDLRGK